MTVLTVRQAAAILQVVPETVKRMLQEGRLKGFKIGNRWRVRQEELDAFMKKGEQR